MKLSLRQARKIENKIKSYCDSFNLKDRINVRVQDDISNINLQLKNACVLFQEMIDLKIELTKIRFAIRNYISEANHSSGINKLLSEIAAYKEIHAFLIVLIGNATIKADDAVIKDRVTMLVKRLQAGNSYSDNVIESFNYIDKETKEQFVNKVHELSKEIEKLSDSVTQLNFTYQITLNEKEYKLLQRCKLL